MKVGVQLHPQDTTVDRLRGAWRAADVLGVDSIWVWDHFFPLYGDPDAAHFEAYTLLAAMAVETTSARLGAMVTCNSYRNANLLADMARTIDHLSSGRFTLGIGSGWFERDYDEYGYEFGTGVDRLRRLEESIGVIRQRLARLTPPSVQPSLPLLIGGAGEKFTLRLTAEHADASNFFGPPENVARKNAVLDEWCARVGRAPSAIERTVCVPPAEVDDVAAYTEAGAQHLIVMLGDPFDMTSVERLLANVR